jgi:GNAT superfamily N-acetyltransferase
MPQGDSMHDMLIQQGEFSEWLSEEPHVVPALLEGYRAAISDIGSNLLTDPRSSKNTHVVNAEFRTQPRYFMGFQPFTEKRQFILSCLYVFPQFRGNGFAKHLLDTAKQIVRDQGFIQIAVEEGKIHELDGLYKKQGFISTGDIISNGFGMAYRDYFWSGKRITLSRVGNTIVVQPHEA